jgi:hypothetical protein
MTAETDRELLELAAKAAKYELRWYSHLRCNGVDICPQLAHINDVVWNPLTDDGDFFRMIALFKPQFGRSNDVAPGREFVWVTLQIGVNEYTGHAYLEDSLTEAFRRAGTKAMALIGKNMP